MNGIVVLLYLAIGVGCGLIRLSAVAVGLIAMVPAVLGAYAVSSNGAMAMLVAALTALLVIEVAYFVTMMAVARIRPTKPAAENNGEHPSGDLHFPRKPHASEEP